MGLSPFRRSEIARLAPGMVTDDMVTDDIIMMFAARSAASAAAVRTILIVRALSC